MKHACAFVAAALLAAPEVFGQASLGRVTTGAWDIFLNDRGGMGRDSLQQGGTWPRGEQNVSTYMHDAGIWFGCYRSSNMTTPLVELSFAPKGAIPLGNYETSFRSLLRGTASEPVYSSLSYNIDGSPKTPGAPAWCIRNVQGGSILQNGNTGMYVRDSAQRAGLPPVFISDQDLVAAFSDSANLTDRYPLGLVGSTTMYAWNNDSLRNCVLIKTRITNASKDTFVDCYIAPVLAFGVGVDSTNDNCDVMLYNDSLGMVYAYSDSESIIRLGAVAVSVINPPRGVKYLGPNTWDNLSDPHSDADRYQHLSQSYVASTYSATWRGLGSSGPFTLKPTESVELVYAIVGGIDTANSLKRDSNLKAVIRTIQAARNFWFAFNVSSGVASDLLPRHHDLFASPNPFDRSTSITLPPDVRPGQFSPDALSLINAVGEVIEGGSRVQFHGQSVTIDGSDLPAGIYQLRVASGRQFRSLELVIIH